MKDSRPLAILLMGPTASGKTDLAMALHQRLGAELISVDSAMVYRGMDIGTAKPSPDEQARAPHRLIDIRDPADPYSAAEFRDDARLEMQRISNDGGIPLLVGGTMLYYRSLLGGVGNLPAADAATRAELEAWAAREGLGALHAKLARVDPESASRIHPNDPQRLMRALEVQRLSQRPMSELWREQRKETFAWQTLSIGLAPMHRSILHERIARRFEQMLEQGFVEEVAALKARHDLHLGLPAMKSVGYRQVWQYLEGVHGRDELAYKGIVATRQLAKRQLTWLRRWPALHWIDPHGPDAVENVLKIVRQCST
ncbi:tRNA dimethylallyltransferase [Modicisalibacter ilicicola DSM 19980]|uniref:tRNA dimethylallyltransferase n=1 Tax=Modicisalibacter ilicicola DSM 19980 TaxID=1121942 RepID=A0A1M4SC46_9GAMM|nr:tRNA (adenosine(37)-N6)-dimethylallyltransferase MiaA [Halomonas ilicicola]SHE29597.1 tRNA dimethylallyltransferase [Halomonas ilicicola DSM 19980]